MSKEGKWLLALQLALMTFAVQFITRPANGQHRIIDGITADAGRYQFYAMITYRDQPKPNEVSVHCGGALIHPLFVVSAYHCFKNVNENQLHERFAVHFLIQNRCKAPDHPPFSVFRVHKLQDPQVSKVIRNDIVVVELLTPVTVDSYARLPMYPLRPSTLGIVVGFGLTRIIGHGSTSDLPCMLQKTNEFVLPLSRCEFSPEKVIGAFCALNPLRGFASACRGDSGGPWITRDLSGIPTLRGVSSFGDSMCNQENTHDAYTDVYHYVNWILNITTARSRGIPMPYAELNPYMQMSLYG